MTLYEINAEIEAAINAIFDSTDEDGVVSDEAVARLSELNEARDEKLDNIGAYIKNIQAEAEAIKAEETKLAQRRKSLENKTKRLLDYVSFMLHGEKWSSARVSFSFRKSNPTIIDDETLIPKKFLKKKIVIEPDKTAIKEAIMSGQKVKGAHIEDKLNIQIK